MRTFDEILDIAADRKGGRGAVLGAIDAPRTADEIAAIPDDRWLAEMTRSVFQAGFNWSVIEKKWDGFEAAFHGFDVGRCAMMSEDWFDALLRDTRIVRNGAKIRSVQQNAVFVQEVSAGAGGFGRRIADWPTEDFAGLLGWLGGNGSRLGGTSGQYLMRKMGKDSFILSRDVVARLVAEGVIDKPPSSKRAMAAVQEAFNTWAAQSGKPLTVISRVLAQSIG